MYWLATASASPANAKNPSGERVRTSSARVTPMCRLVDTGAHLSMCASREPLASGYAANTARVQIASLSAAISTSASAATARSRWSTIISDACGVVPAMAWARVVPLPRRAVRQFHRGPQGIRLKKRLGRRPTPSDPPRSSRRSQPGSTSPAQSALGP
ncbi:hypothetical protein ACFFX0_23350 [Citricoccus parietis]|uniref:Peptidase A2 domain-containing protein n=1 Tax=Citricoccus parietis TaxID=592307 RepID=A0ABV5G4U8_9MICC